MNKKMVIRKCIVLFVTSVCLVSCVVFFGNTAFADDVETYFDTCPAYPLSAGDMPEPGKVYYWEEDEASGLNGLTDTIYLAGNLPILITVPHGGRTYENGNIALPDRQCGTDNKDAYTMKMAYYLMLEIEKEFGGYPHIIMSRLPREKIDHNRALDEDCNPDDNPRGIKAWNDFHMNFKAIAVNTILSSDLGKGLYIDVHGKSNNYGASVHVGYHLTSTDLYWNSNSSLNDESKRFIDDSSIRFMYKNIKQDSPDVLFTDLLTGDRSFGTILYDYVNTIPDYYYSFTVSPRSDLTRPYPYYSGAYNVLNFCGPTQANDNVDYNAPVYGNYYNANKFISGFQLETSYRLRESHLDEYVEDVTLAIRDYLEMNFGYYQ